MLAADSKKQPGFELYTLRDRTPRDHDDILTEPAEIGYEEVGPATSYAGMESKPDAAPHPCSAVSSYRSSISSQSRQTSTQPAARKSLSGNPPQSTPTVLSPICPAASAS